MSDAEAWATALIMYAETASPEESFGAWLARNSGPIDWSKTPRLRFKYKDGTFHERKAKRIAERAKKT